MAAPLLCARVTQACIANISYCRMFVAKYAKKVTPGGKPGAQPIKKVEIEVEIDPVKLTTFCCGANIYKTGSDPELKPNSEYPDWLWSLRLDRRPQDLSELDPDDFHYWRRLRKLTLRQKNQLRKLNKLK